jgi:hypothetical protein
MKLGDNVVIRLGSYALMEATVVGGYRKLSDGSEWYILEDTCGTIHIRPKTAFVTEGKPGHTLSKYIA